MKLTSFLGMAQSSSRVTQALHNAGWDNGIAKRRDGGTAYGRRWIRRAAISQCLGLRLEAGLVHR